MKLIPTKPTNYLISFLMIGIKVLGNDDKIIVLKKRSGQAFTKLIRLSNLAFESFVKAPKGCDINKRISFHYSFGDVS
jgi:hypothetical protein